MIDDHYGFFSDPGNGWGDKSAPVKIDPANIPAEHLPTVQGLVRQVIRRDNFLLDTQFEDPVVEPLDQIHYARWRFIGILFSENTREGIFASAQPLANWSTNAWEGGRVILYIKTFLGWFWQTGRILLTIYRIVGHELGHVKGAVHTDIEPAMMNGSVSAHPLNQLGWLPWDLAVVSKIMAGYESGEYPPYPIPVRVNAHFTAVEGREWLFVPLVEYEGELWVLVMENTAANAWRPVYYKRLSRSAFDNPGDYAFSGVSAMTDDELFMPSSYQDDDVRARTMRKDSMGVWRLV